MTGWRRAMAALSVAVLLPACASSRTSSARAVASHTPPASPASSPVCAEPGDRMRLAALATGLGTTTLMMLRGAAEGASAASGSGGNMGTGAWIGAAVGLGVGALVGVTAGVMKGLEQAWQRPACLVAQAEDADARLTALELETLLPDD